MTELLSQGLVVLSTWAWLEVHSTSLALMLAALVAGALLAVVAAALVATVLRRGGAACLPEAAHEPTYIVAVPGPTRHRPVGGRGARAPGAASGRLVLL